MNKKFSRRRFMQASALASTGAAFGLQGLPAFAEPIRRQAEQEYIYLSIVTQEKDYVSQPLPFFGYPFLVATLLGWAWERFRSVAQ